MTILILFMDLQIPYLKHEHMFAPSLENLQDINFKYKPGKKAYIDQIPFRSRSEAVLPQHLPQFFFPEEKY